MSPPSSAQFFQDQGPVHARSYIALSISRKHRLGDISAKGSAHASVMRHQGPFPPGERLRTARIRAQLTQKALSGLAGVTQSTVSEFETGKSRDMDATSFVALCVAVSVPAEYVLLGARAARDDEEAEAIELLRGAKDAERAQAMKSLRGMLAMEDAAPRKQSRKRVA